MDAVFVRFCVIQACFWGFEAAMPGYMSAYMLSQGVSASMLGVLLSSQLLCAFLGSLFWGRWVDRHQASRRFFLMATASAGILSMALYALVPHALAMMVLYPLFGFMNGAIATTLDAWVIASYPGQPQAGARSRSFATLSYAVVMLLTGLAVRGVGYVVMPVIGLALLVIAFVTALMQQEMKPQLSLVRNQARPSPKALLSSRVYVLLVAGMFFTGLSIAPINNMKMVILESVGGDVGILGLDSFIGCMVQAPFLLMAGHIQRYGTDKRLMVGVAAAAGYAALILMASSPAMVIAGTVMNNIAFGLLYPTMRQMTEEHVSPALRNTAHAVVDVAYGSLSGMISSSWSGAVIEASGMRALASLSLVTAAIAVVLCLMCVAQIKPHATCHAHHAA